MRPKVGDIITVRTNDKEWYGGIHPYDGLRGKVIRLTKGEYLLMDLLPEHIKHLKNRGYGRYKTEDIMVPYWAVALEQRGWMSDKTVMEVE